MQFRTKLGLVDIPNEEVLSAARDIAGSELSPYEIAAPLGSLGVVGGSVAGGKLTQRQFENLQSWMKNSRRLESLTPRELIAECLKSEAADYDVTVELMNRLLPGWQNEPVGAYDEPQNIGSEPRP